MKVQVTLVLILFQFLYQNGNGLDTLLKMWEKHSCKDNNGWVRADVIQDDKDCEKWPKAGGKRSFGMIFGSCLEMFESESCNHEDGASKIIHSTDTCTQLGGHDDMKNVKSAKPCTKKQVARQCSSGEIVTAVEVTDDGGLYIKCQPLESTLLPYNYNVHHLNNHHIVPSPSGPTCAKGVRGLVVGRDSRRRIVNMVEPSCFHEGEQCPPDEVMIGMNTYIEEHTNAVKNISIICAPFKSL